MAPIGSSSRVEVLTGVHELVGKMVRTVRKISKSLSFVLSSRLLQKALPTFPVIFPTSTNPIKKIPDTCSKRVHSELILNSAKLTIEINQLNSSKFFFKTENTSFHTRKPGTLVVLRQKNCK